MIYDNVIALCREKGISVSALEKKCGLGNATIKGWKVSSPRVESLQKVADYFDITIDELLSGEQKRGA